MKRSAVFVIAASVALAGQTPAPRLHEWPSYAADSDSTHYSPIRDINRENVSGVQRAWEWKTAEEPLSEYGTRPGMFENTPLMIDDVLYLSTPYNRVVALNAETGAELWTFDPKAYVDGQPPNGTGFVHRGVAAWRDGNDLRIFMNSRARLFCLDARTGRLVESFGDRGMVDLSKGLRWAVDPKRYTNTSPPVIYKDLVILGNGVGDRLMYKNDPPGDVRAFDVRTGKQVWTFHTIPTRADDPVAATWANDSWKVTGHANVWAPFTVDVQRGLVYLPVSTPSNDYYGVHRLGDNLFADSIVCLDAATGARKWHFQVSHHGLWDYDPPAAPVLVSIRVNKRQVDAVVQVTKQGFTFVFDRVTGEPLWPIEERPVPASDVPGEKAAPTQPFPTKPAAITPQGVTLDDAFDLTPELKAQAQEQMKKFKLGPLYTPPSLQGTLQRPGVIGGANWGGAAFDPETQTLYVKTSNAPAVVRIHAFDRSPGNPWASEVDADFIGDVGGSTNFTPHGSGERGLPLVKPPYGELVAIDLNSGDVRWRAPFGDTSSIRSHPALANVKLPARLGASGVGGVIATRGGLIIGAGGDSVLYAFDKSTGQELASLDLGRRASSTPMTYRTKSGRQFVVIAAGQGTNAALMAFTLPRGQISIF
jgi:quinoprotein glucose dehydrogenase